MQIPHRCRVLGAATAGESYDHDVSLDVGTRGVLDHIKAVKHLTISVLLKVLPMFMHAIEGVKLVNYIGS